MKYEHRSLEGQPFTIYALVCPRTRLVRYVGQTSTSLGQRTYNHTPYHFQGAMRDWLESLLPDKPIAVILETGINRRVRVADGRAHYPAADVWFSTIRETTWQKRLRRTLFNTDPLESSEVSRLLKNSPLPWYPSH